MIQRLQSLVLILAALSSIIIVFRFPVLQNGEISVTMLDARLFFARLSLFFSAGLNIFSVFQFANRNRQIFINQISKIFLSIGFLVVIFKMEDLNFAVGLFLLVLPYLLIILANYLIRKDERLVKSADRIR